MTTSRPPRISTISGDAIANTVCQIKHQLIQIRDATFNDLPVLRKVVEDVRKPLDGLTDGDAMTLTERRRTVESRAGNVPVKQAEFDVLNISIGSRGRDESDSPFLAEALPRSTWGPENYPASRPIARILLVHHLREVVALFGFTRFEPAGTDEMGELDLDGITAAALVPEPEWFPAIENRDEGIFIVISPEAIGNWREQEGFADAALSSLPAEMLGIRSMLPPEISWRPIHHAVFARAHAADSNFLDCGYPAAVLRERIYALREPGMYGILIHIDTSEAEQTLGGLVETGKYRRPSARGAWRRSSILERTGLCRARSRRRT